MRGCEIIPYIMLSWKGAAYLRKEQPTIRKLLTWKERQAPGYSNLPNLNSMMKDCIK
jgi:hypothetical protein